MSEFSALNLHPELVQTVTDLGYTAPTPIQAALIPVMLSGKDVIGQAQTGTGKTAAFALPMLNGIEAGTGSVQGLVLAPTRELALQVADAMYQYGKDRRARVLPVFGGQPYSKQIQRLRSGVDIVVGTPGRLLDLIRRRALDLSHVSTVVLDEADEMLSMGFIEDIEEILAATPADRQTALLSATLPKPIRRLAGKYMNDPVSCTIENTQRTVSAIEERYYLVNERDKLAALTRLFEAEAPRSAIIFARTRVGTRELATALTEQGISAEALNGDMDQNARTAVLNRFRKHQVKILVGTDVAARGLDIDDISHVVNYDLPHDPEVYVHRVGRTGRAGRGGIAITLVTPAHRGRLRRIEAYTKHKIAQTPLPTIEDIQQLRDARLSERVVVWLERDRCNQEKELVAHLVAAGYAPEAIAAAALKLVRTEGRQRPLKKISEVKEERSFRSKDRSFGSKKEFGARKRTGKGQSRPTFEKGMVALTLSTGKADGTAARHVVGALAHFAGIPGHALGKIRIQHKHTMVDVPEQLVEQVLAKNGSYQIGRQRITVKRA